MDGEYYARIVTLLLRLFVESLPTENRAPGHQSFGFSFYTLRSDTGQLLQVLSISSFVFEDFASVAGTCSHFPCSTITSRGVQPEGEIQPKSVAVPVVRVIERTPRIDKLRDQLSSATFSVKLTETKLEL